MRGADEGARSGARARRAVAALGLATLAGLGACGGDGTGPGAEVVPAELVGRWVAEPACLPLCGFTLSSVANPADSINVTSFAGISTEITMTREGTFRLLTRPGPDTASTATVRVIPGALVVTDRLGTVDTLDYQLAGEYLRLQFRRTFTAFDFTGDGVNDPANARGSFRRR
jgi:hypothetical protein